MMGSLYITKGKLMNYDNYFVENEKIMTLEDIKEYAKNRESAYMLIKKENDKGEKYRLEKVVILSVHQKKNDFNDYSEMRLSVITLYDELHKHISLSDMGKYFVLLKSKPGEKYIKVSVENMVPQGEFCKDCRYWSNKKIFSDEYSKYHDASCFLFLKYLDADQKMGELIKCEECMKITS